MLIRLIADAPEAKPTRHKIMRASCLCSASGLTRSGKEWAIVLRRFGLFQSGLFLFTSRVLPRPATAHLLSCSAAVTQVKCSAFNILHGTQ